MAWRVNLEVDHKMTYTKWVQIAYDDSKLTTGYPQDTGVVRPEWRDRSGVVGFIISPSCSVQITKYQTFFAFKHLRFRFRFGHVTSFDRRQSRARFLLYLRFIKYGWTVNKTSSEAIKSLGCRTFYNIIDKCSHPFRIFVKYSSNENFILLQKYIIYLCNQISDGERYGNPPLRSHHSGPMHQSGPTTPDHSGLQGIASHYRSASLKLLRCHLRVYL